VVLSGFAADYSSGRWRGQGGQARCRQRIIAAALSNPVMTDARSGYN